MRDPLLDLMIQGLMAQRAVDTSLQEQKKKMRAVRCKADRIEADRKQSQAVGPCLKCRRVFQSKSEYRYAAGLKGYICRDDRGCRQRAEQNPC